MTPALSTNDVDRQQLYGTGWSDVWVRHTAILACGWAFLLSLFHRDVMHMASIWWNASTFNHCLLILPIIGWLIYQRKDQLVLLRPVCWWPGLIWLAGGAFAWLLGDAAGVGLLRQGGIIVMLQGLVFALLGRNVARGLAFPFFYMFFLVPFGEEIVPLLQTITAKMCMVLLALVNVPAKIDGIFITTAGGYFKVAEACSGVKFLIAMVALGALVSSLCFKTLRRRAVFMLACFVVPVLTNSVRAWGTIMIAQNGNIDFAASFDHVFYGWIFFAIVIFIVMGLGWKFFDKDPLAPAFNVTDLQGPMEARIGINLAAVLAALLIAAPMIWSIAAKPDRDSLPAYIALPHVVGWQIVPYQPKHGWYPRFDGNDHHLLGRYRNAAGQEVDLYIAIYGYQDEGREMIGYGQGAVDQDSDWAWAADLPAPIYGKSERIKAPGPSVREVDSFYRVGGMTSGGASQVKWQTLKVRLLGSDQRAAAILISGEFHGEKSPRPAIDAFRASIGDVGRFADRMAENH
jgi:exosortase A